MFRKLRSVAIVLAGLAVLTASAAQARSFAPGLIPSSFLAEVWDWVVSDASSWVKAGGDMDPNGYKHPRGPRPGPHAGRRPGPRGPVKAGGDMDPNG
jgi:hypothetical protein